MAYILFYKYAECITRIRRHPEYKKNEEYYVSMFNLKETMRLGTENFESLSLALEVRYGVKEETRTEVVSLKSELQTMELKMKLMMQ